MVMVVEIAEMVDRHDPAAPAKGNGNQHFYTQGELRSFVQEHQKLPGRHFFFDAPSESKDALEAFRNEIRALELSSENHISWLAYDNKSAVSPLEVFVLDSQKSDVQEPKDKKQGARLSLSQAAGGQKCEFTLLEREPDEIIELPAFLGPGSKDITVEQAKIMLAAYNRLTAETISRQKKYLKSRLAWIFA